MLHDSWVDEEVNSKQTILLNHIDINSNCFCHSYHHCKANYYSSKMF